MTTSKKNKEKNIRIARNYNDHYEV